MPTSSVSLREEALRELLSATVLENRYIPHDPHPKQAKFLCLLQKEAFYGGAAGGGKSEALLMAALQYVHRPDYAALILRRTFQRLAKPEAIMDRAKSWLLPMGVWWSSTEHMFHFPSGATLSFGHLEHEDDKYQYQGSEFQFIGFDEATEFLEPQYTFLFSRLRRTTDSTIPLRMRATSNPGGVGHDWVYQRFIVEGENAGRPFIPAKLEDNPSLDQEAYIESLMELDSVTRKRLLDGDWTARSGKLFRREWFNIVEPPGPSLKTRLRYWDLGATKVKPGTDPDWTAGALVGMKDGVYWIYNINRFRETPRMTEAAIKLDAQLDGRGVAIWMEQEPGASGVNTIDHYRRKVLAGYEFHKHRPTGPKPEYWRVLSSAAEAENVNLVRGDWINWWFDEIEAAPDGAHDDGLDAASRAVAILSRLGERDDEGPLVE